MSDNYSVGRFEWLTIPSSREPSGSCEEIADVFVAKKCPECAWVDGDHRFEAISGEPGSRECFRCGAHWDLSKEINDFFKQEQIKIPAVCVDRDMDGVKGFYRGRKESDPRLFDLRVMAEGFCLRKGFDELLALSVSRIDRFDHQISAARTILKKMRGKVLLADEVGLGKTVEAGLVIKELLIRGIANSVLVMVPAGLTDQWKEELKYKFNENFTLFKKHRLEEDDRRLIVSYDLAKRRECLQTRYWDVIVYDEAHRLKSRSTAVSKFARGLRGRFVLALSATPIQNSLNELYSLIDLIKPGKLGTVRAFRRAFVSRGNPRKVLPGRESALRAELGDVMIRNRRDTCKLKFPKRRAGIYYVDPLPDEITLYQKVTRYVKKEFKKEFFKETGRKIHMLSLIILQRELMSSPAAVQSTLLRIAHRKGYPEATKKRLTGFADIAGTIETPSKIRALKEILVQFKGNRFVVFTEFVKSLETIVEHVGRWGLAVFSISGKMPAKKRASVLADFRNTSSSILVSTETGGVGLNLQFCSHLVNFDLPWNPTRVEQRIGRIDRIGQKNEVYVFNLACKNTIEEYVIDILAKKLRMFEMVIGECGAVLGHMEHGKSFEQMVVEVWANNSSEKEEAGGFSKLAAEAEKARTLYEKSRQASSVLNQIGRCA
ncbi:DEAD/DEAH box helicase [Thermodesulfobacteriota bacterium]